jgi:hypothetical protein
VARVIIGMDPHKRSATIEVIDGREKILARGRYGTDSDGYRAMLAAGRRYPQRLWAVEGCNGIGRHVAQRLVADREMVVDVPAKLSARARVFGTGQGRKTDPVDAHSVAVAALRTTSLRPVTVDDATVALRLMVDRRDWLGQARTDTVNRLHALLLDLVPGGAKKHLTAPQARTILATVRSRDVVGRTRRQLASELITELAVIDKKIKQANAALTELIAATGSKLQQLNGSARQWRLGCWATSAISAGSPAATTLRPGTAPHRWTPPRATSTAIACPGLETGVSTGPCTSWPSSSCATTPRAVRTSGVSSPLARPRWKPCAASNDDYPMWSIGKWSPTRR